MCSEYPLRFLNTRRFLEYPLRAKARGEIDSLLVFCPLQIHVDQMARRVQKAMPTGEVVKIMSSDTRDPETVRRVLEAGGAAVACNSEESAAIALQAMLMLPPMSRVLVVVDESHNLTLSQVKDSKNPLHRLLWAASKRLFVSATPRSYEIAIDGTVENVAQESALIGPVIPGAEMSWAEAKDKSLIVPFQVLVPLIQRRARADRRSGLSDNESAVIQRVRCPSPIAVPGADFAARTLALQALFVLQGMYETGARRCIIYLSTGPGRTGREQADLMERALRAACEIEEGGEVLFGRILASTSNKEREQVLANFSERDAEPMYRCRFILSVRCLDEAVDIPACDAIFITSPSDPLEGMRMIQRAARAMRNDPHNATKRATVMLWVEPSFALLENLDSACGASIA